MLALPKLPFVATGALEAVAQLLMLAGASRLPGALLPLLMQTALFWNLAFSALLLGMRWGLGFARMEGCCLRLWGKCSMPRLRSFRQPPISNSHHLQLHLQPPRCAGVRPWPAVPDPSLPCATVAPAAGRRWRSCWACS